MRYVGLSSLRKPLYRSVHLCIFPAYVSFKTDISSLVCCTIKTATCTQQLDLIAVLSSVLTSDVTFFLMLYGDLSRAYSCVLERWHKQLYVTACRRRWRLGWLLAREMARSESTVASRLQVFWDQTSKSAQIWRPVSFYHSHASCSFCFLQGGSICSSPTCFNISYFTSNVDAVHPAAQNVM